MTAGKMKAMKTVEEMRVAVLAECETICPNVGDFSRVRLLWIGKIERTSEVGFDPHYDGKIWAIFAHGGGEILYFIHEDSDEAIIDFAYMLFGFAERDAVQLAENECTKRVWAKDDLANHLLTKITDLKSKNAALVDRIELALSLSEDSDINRILGNALAANEKGGKGE